MTMFFIKIKLCHCLLLIVFLSECLNLAQSLIKKRNTRHTGKISGVSSPLLGDEIDLDTIEGVEQVTKLVLIKTDSLPGESDERIDGRYLNSLMETLYTGLRKPFKSVSADILGIFPSFEEIQVRCRKTKNSNVDNNLEKDESISIKRRAVGEKQNNQNSSSHKNEFSSIEYDNLADETMLKSDIGRNDSMNIEVQDSNEMTQIPYKSSLQVCQTVTNDCLSMENLIQILPPTITTFDKAIVRLCPIMLFRIMNHLCEKSSLSGSNRQQEVIKTAYQAGKMREDADGLNNKNGDSISLNTLLRETKILKNLQSSDELGSKKPQKLHKKLKTQTPYKGNSRNTNGLQQHGSVDEQLLKIRLKLTEPSIEKVWIFSLLFVILSIVVSMGGLIVLPFVRKTTRRRILTLFEGLAVGGLAGSATLHMFPQAFGLVDENYHKYFWRIFVVFFGIYLCYLCERVIKIFKVVRAKSRRRSHASLIDMDFCYGFPSLSREISRNAPNRLSGVNFDREANVQFSNYKRKSSQTKSKSRESDGYEDSIKSGQYNNRKKKGMITERSVLTSIHSKNKSKKSASKIKRDILDSMLRLKPNEAPSANNASDLDSISLNADQTQTRQRLVHCLKSVQRQFSPVYAVQTLNIDGTTPIDEPRAGRLARLSNYNQDKKRKLRREVKLPSKTRKNRILEPNQIFTKVQQKSSSKRNQKQRDIETMLYHQSVARHSRERDNLNRDYLQHRLTGVNDVAAERQDQDNAARMSVDTVAWMIVFGDAVLNVIDGLSIGAAFERNILAGISISVAVMLEEVTHRLGTFAVLIRAGMSMQQSLLCTFLSACALFPGLIVGILLSDATEDATPYIFCAAGGIFLYMALVDVMKEMNRSIENAIRKDIKSTLQIFALQNVGIILAVIFLSFLALYEQAMDFEEYQIQYNQPS